MRRLFVAIEIPDTIREKISDSISNLKKTVDGNFVDKDKLHVTILFIGESILSTEEISKIVREEKIKARIELTGFGEFPDAKRPRVLFIDVKTELRGTYLSLCKKLDIKAENDFHLHITVCRIKSSKPDIDRINASIKINESFEAENLSLFDSDFKSYYKIC